MNLVTILGPEDVKSEMRTSTTLTLNRVYLENKLLFLVYNSAER